MFTPTQGLRTTNEGINGPNVVDKQASVVTKILVLGCKFRTLQAIFLDITNPFFMRQYMPWNQTKMKVLTKLYQFLKQIEEIGFSKWAFYYWERYILEYMQNYHLKSIQNYVPGPFCPPPASSTRSSELYQMASKT